MKLEEGLRKWYRFRINTANTGVFVASCVWEGQVQCGEDQLYGHKKYCQLINGSFSKIQNCYVGKKMRFRELK